MSEHTPGPWVGFSDEGRLVAMMPAGRDGDICSFMVSPSEADGSLMLAAPDLLMVAQAAEIALRNRDQSVAEARLLAAIKIAIAKAIGAN